MCLDMRFKPKVEKKMIAKLPDGLITVYRIVDIHTDYCGVGWYTAWFSRDTFKVGLNRAKDSHSPRLQSCRNEYKPGYHSYKTQMGMKKAWFNTTGPNSQRWVKFQIRKEWITAIGQSNRYTVYVTDRIISPSLRDKSAVTT